MKLEDSVCNRVFLFIGCTGWYYNYRPLHLPRPIRGMSILFQWLYPFGASFFAVLVPRIQSGVIHIRPLRGLYFSAYSVSSA